MLTVMKSRSTHGVAAYYHDEDIGSNDIDTWASLLEEIDGKLYVDDSDEEPTREGGCVSTRMYCLDDIDTWPPTLFERLSGYTWWIDPEDEINILDVLAAQEGIRK